MKMVQIGSADPKYLSTTDILIGDMSDINYEFLLFDRPIILLVNEWLRENFPDIGIKADLSSLESAIKRCLASPGEYREQRRKWLEKTIHKPFEDASARVLKLAITKSGYRRPDIVVIHGASEVRKTNLEPLYDEAARQGLRAYFVSRATRTTSGRESIYFAAHFEDLFMKDGYRVHLDHGLKGQGTANIEISKQDYLRHSFFPLIDLHITAGQVGNERTQMLLGPNKDRTAIAGYPKADQLNKLKSSGNRKVVLQELGFDANKPLRLLEGRVTKSRVAP